MRYLDNSILPLSFTNDNVIATESNIHAQIRTFNTSIFQLMYFVCFKPKCLNNSCM